MSFSRFIARRLLFTPKGTRNPVTTIATGGIALGMAVMIVAVMVVTGFRNEITNKVSGFGGHIRISGFDNNNSYEENPVNRYPPFLQQLAQLKDVKHINEYATKAGIIKTENEIQGCVLKGVGTDFDWTFFKDKLVSGQLPANGDSASQLNIIVSRTVAQKLNLKTGDAMVVYFIEQPPRIRKFKISGIYETGLGEFDEIYVYCNIDVIRRLNDWNEKQTGGFELTINDFSKLNSVTDEVYSIAGYEFNTMSIEEQYPQIFHWLDLQNINVIIIIILILCVAGISMITTLLIIILDNTALIGIFKSLGATDRTIRTTFMYLAVPVIGRGILIGNLIGITLCLLQLQFGIVTLPQESYYVSHVPIDFSISNLLLLNLGTIVACLILLVAPSMIISRITPTRVIRFD
ncbi:MAG TPA: ABC transporter permease [Bacteroidia bacterium]|nr:ABC transporter permease [Bacteroidia bacterium]